MKSLTTLMAAAAALFSPPTRKVLPNPIEAPFWSMPPRTRSGSKKPRCKCHNRARAKAARKARRAQRSK